MDNKIEIYIPDTHIIEIYRESKVISRSCLNGTQWSILVKTKLLAGNWMKYLILEGNDCTRPLTEHTLMTSS